MKYAAIIEYLQDKAKVAEIRAVHRQYLTGLWSVALEAAEKAGRDPGALRRVLRINPRNGTGVETVADVLPCLDVAREEGITEVLVDLHFVAKDVDHALELAAELRAAA